MSSVIAAPVNGIQRQNSSISDLIRSAAEIASELSTPDEGLGGGV
jgi:hypothetical protein